MKLEMSGITPGQIKLLLVILIVAVLGLPYYLVVMPARQASASLQNSISSLQTEKANLEAARLREPEYIAGIAENEKKANEILKRYPRALPQEASVLFIVATEELIPGLRLDSVSFGTPSDKQITGVIIDEYGNAVPVESGEDAAIDANVTVTPIGAILTAATMDLNFNYSVGYSEFKDFFSYILAYDERRVIKNISVNFDPANQRVMGNFALSIFAVNGPGRPPVVIAAPDFELGARNIFLQARGLHYIEDDVYLAPDFFVEFKHSEDDAETDAVSAGRTNDRNNATRIAKALSETSAVNITFSGSDGIYTVAYSIDEEVYEGDTELFFKDDPLATLNIDVYSAERFGHTHPATTIYVNNQTDLVIYVTIYGDDAVNPLQTFETTGAEVYIRNWVEPEVEAW
jgi:hypothetical protein